MLIQKFKFLTNTYFSVPFFSLVGVVILVVSPLRQVDVPYFVVYHTLLEAICFVVSFLIFMTQFVLRNHSTSGLYQILGIPFLGIGIIDLLHTLSYQGLPHLVTPNSPQKSIAFWLAARVLEAGIFLFFTLGLKYKWWLKNSQYLWVYGFVILYTGLATGIILGFPQVLPMFSDEFGHITVLKKGIEYLLILSHLVIYILLFFSSEDRATSEVKKLLLTASLIIAVSGLCFSSFSEGHDLVIFAGHLLKVAAYYFIFGAALQSELLRPYDHLNELKKYLQIQTESLRNIEIQLLKSERLNSVGLNAGRVLHDLNNMVLIANISAKKILNLVSENESAEKIKNYSNTIVNSLAKTQQLQQHLLKQVKNNADKEIVSELQGELKQFSQLLKVLAGNNELVIECDEMLSVQVNQVELEQVLMNLVTNASDAFGDKNGKITISAKKRVVGLSIVSLTGVIAPGNYIELSVTDNGSGISEEALPKIFEPFFTTKTHAKGTGLGLYTVKSIVEKWNAHLQIQSSLGKGTEFSIFFKSLLTNS